MKRFITLLALIAIAVGIVFGTIYLLRDDEKISLDEHILYVSVGDKFKITLNHEKPKKSTKITIEHDALVAYDAAEDTFQALTGGTAVINYQSTNTKYRNNSVTVFIGNGEIMTPFYISTPEQLMSIGAPGVAGKDNPFTLDKYYKLVNNIDLSGIDWEPIAIHQNGNMNFDSTGITTNYGFIGELEGDGYTIKNGIIDTNKYPNHTKNNAGIFYNIGYYGRVVNVKFDNITIISKPNRALDYVGIVSGETRGEIERVHVTNSRILVENAKAIGGITGSLLSGAYGYVSPDESQEPYTRTIAELDRVGAEVVLGKGNVLVDGEMAEISGGVGGYVGGIVGRNMAGVIVYSYANGQAYVNNHTKAYGGIVGVNEIINYAAAPYAEPEIIKRNYKYQINGAKIKDTYSASTLYRANYTLEARLIAGGIVGTHNDLHLYDPEENQDLEHLKAHKIIGSYYEKDRINNWTETVVATVTVEETIYNEETGQNEIVTREEERSVQVNSEHVSGIGLVLLEGQQTIYPNKEFFILSKALSELKNKNSYDSYMKTTLIADENSEQGFREVDDQVEKWLFGSVWEINSSVNEGLPTLTYAHINVANNVEIDIENIAISSAQELANIKLDGSYVIISNIDLSNPAGIDKEADPNGDWSPWVPIGTRSNPFIGNLKSATIVNETTGVKSYFKIYGLTVYNTEEDYTNAGLFGVTSNSALGSIKDLVIEKANIKDAINAGVVVGSNGFREADETANITSKAGSVGIDIQNVTVLDSKVVAVKNAGGIAGVNTGNMNKVLVEGTNVSVNASDEGNVGGIAGINFGTINNAIIRSASNVVAENGQSVNAGGIAGANASDGTIKNSVVRLIEISSKRTTKTENVLDKNNNPIPVLDSEGNPVLDGNDDPVYETRRTDSYIPGKFGGITGLNWGRIEFSVVRATITADTKTIGHYVGGVTGRLEEMGMISDVLVYSTVLTGNIAGGIAAEIENKQTDSHINIAFNANGLIQASSENVLTVRRVGVENSVIIGKISGGLAGRVINGIISDAYIMRSTLKTTDDPNSFAGGIAGEVLHSTAEGLKVGIIQKVYNSTKFEGNGKAYAVSKSEFLKDYLIKEIPLLGIKFERSAGYVVAYLFDDSVDGNAEKPESSNWFKDRWTEFTQAINNWINWIPVYGTYAPTNSVDLMKSNKFSEFKFDLSVWTFTENEYARITSLVRLEEELTQRVVTLEVSRNYKVVASSEDVAVREYSQGGKNYMEFLVLEGSNFEFRVEVINNSDDRYNNYVVIAGDRQYTPGENGLVTLRAAYKNISMKVVPLFELPQS